MLLRDRAGVTTLALIALLTALPVAAQAGEKEEAAQAVLTGKELAKAEDFAGALIAFKRGDKLVARAEHACLISLAYFRQGNVGQAELFASVCASRATKSDPVPTWSAAVNKEIQAQLASWTPVEISVENADGLGNIRISASVFAADETFPPRTIYVKPGPLTLTASAAGIAPVTKTVRIDGDAAVKVVIDLRPAAKPPVDTTVGDGGKLGNPALDTNAGSSANGNGADQGKGSGADLSKPAVGPTRKRVGLTTGSWLALGGAGVALVTGAVFHSMTLSSKTILEDAISVDD